MEWNQNYIAIIPAITDELDENYNINGGFTEKQGHTFKLAFFLLLPAKSVVATSTSEIYEQ